MISEFEIIEHARESGVPPSTIERDYAQNWLLAGLSKSRFPVALKGGTGIRKVYIKDYRFSDDLDFTLLENLELNKIKTYVIDAVETSKNESGIDFDKNIKIREIENGYEITVYFRILRKAGNPLRIKIDITKKDNEIIVLNLEKREIIHPYSDDCKAKVLAYSLKEILAEKVRSLFQRTRPRDLYDVWYLLSKYKLSISDVSHIVAKKCKFKSVKLDFKELIRRRDNFRSAWKSSLKHQLKDLPDFERVFEEVIGKIKVLKHIENVTRDF